MNFIAPVAYPVFRLYSDRRVHYFRQLFGNVVCTATSQENKIVQIQSAIPRDTVREYLQLSTVPEGPCNLCMKHYSQLYRHINPYACLFCGATPKPSTTFSRHSPDAHNISKQLSEIMDTTITIQPKNWICNRCYKIHLNILKDTLDG